MRVIGDVEEVVQLENGIRGCLMRINQALKSIRMALTAVGESWNDEGYRQLNGIVMDVMKSVTSHMDDISNLLTALKEYEEILSGTGSGGIGTGSQNMGSGAVAVGTVAMIRAVSEQQNAEKASGTAVCNGIPDYMFGSFADKIRKFFKPSKDSDSIGPGTDNALEPGQDIQTVWTPPAMEGVDVREPEADIAPLDATRQSINLVVLPDGSKAKVFDHPSNLRNTLPFSQGQNEYSKGGTCALADTGVWLKIAGSRHVENDVVGFASTHKDRNGKPLCSKSGGTLPSNIPDIWEHFGMPAYSDSSKNIESIAEAVESGRAVSVGVNAGMLWEQDNAEGIKIPQDCYGDGGANHAIGIMSCERDPVSGSITHFYINDTGRAYKRDACRRISVSDFLKAFNVKRACATISQKPVW